SFRTSACRSWAAALASRSSETCSSRRATSWRSDRISASKLSISSRERISCSSIRATSRRARSSFSSRLDTSWVKRATATFPSVSLPFQIPKQLACVPLLLFQLRAPLRQLPEILLQARLPQPGFLPVRPVARDSLLQGPAFGGQFPLAPLQLLFPQAEVFPPL